MCFEINGNYYTLVKFVVLEVFVCVRQRVSYSGGLNLECRVYDSGRE